MTLPQKSGSLESWDSRKLGYWVNGFLESREPGSLECWNTDEPCEGTDEGSTVSVSMTGGARALSGRTRSRANRSCRLQFVNALIVKDGRVDVIDFTSQV